MEKNRACPKCRENGHDSTGDHLFLMKDTKNIFFCNHSQYHTSGKTYRVDYDVEEDEPDVLEMAIEEVGGSFTETSSDSFKDACEYIEEAIAGPITPVSSGLTYEDSVCRFRGIRPETYDYYGFRGTYRSEDEELVKITWDMYEDGKVIGQKHRILPKDFRSTPLKGRKLEFTGQHKYPAGGKRLIIVEGEQDMCAAYQMISDKYTCHVVSVPIGADEKVMRVFNDQKKWLKKWKELVICFDEDEAGNEATKMVYGLYPDIFVMNMSENDPNEMLIEGKEEEFISAYFSAEKWKPSSIVSIMDLVEEATEKIKWGLDYPFEQLTNSTYGSRGGSIVCVVGAPGGGKSTVVEQIEEHFMTHHKMGIGIFDLENPPALTLRKAIGNRMNLPIHLPDCVYNIDDARDIAKEYDGLMNIYDHSGYRDWSDIMMYIRYLHTQGVTRFFIDPLSALVTHLDASEANTYISNAMMDMSKYVQENKDIQIFHTNHANNGTGKDAGAGGRIYGGQITGSRSQWRFSTDVISVERDQTHEIEEERSKVTLRLIKNRMAGNTNAMELIYNKVTGKLEEERHEF